RRNCPRHAHHLRGVFNQSTAASVVISSGRGGSPETLTQFLNERIAQGAQTRIADCRDRLEDELPICVLFCTQFGRALQPFILLLWRQRSNRPLLCFETVLRMRTKFAG